LILTVNDDIEIVARDGSSTIRLPLAVYAGSFPSAVPDTLLVDGIPNNKYALSRSAERLAVSLGDGRIFIFECH
jgi:hypothetical protein